MAEKMTLHRCAECGWVTVGGSIHGCVSCLTKREPEPFEVVPCDEAAVERVTAVLLDAFGPIGDIREVAEDALRAAGGLADG